ncbi:hypothetical protein U9M48_010085 [Paspalum notatum var. saurae]|uniref:GIR1-like zinc ribbon domain-containing protein n=1 Tax=Paspalum notatum var. saurae TaxID=547442 RepID=A0AAQ3WFU5_PASNO
MARPFVPPPPLPFIIPSSARRPPAPAGLHSTTVSLPSPLLVLVPGGWAGSKSDTPASSQGEARRVASRGWLLHAVVEVELAKAMAAEALGFMARGASGGRAAELVTRDFLGGCAATDDARDAAARHDAAGPGKLSLQTHACPATPRDLNLFPVAAATKPCAVTTAPAPAPPSSSSGGVGATATYHSVCTIEKVKTALERFERGKHQHQHQHQQHSGPGACASPSSSSVTTSSVKRRGGDSSGGVEQGDGCDSPSGGGGMVAAACPRCFLYVLISRSDPRCPRCESHVPAPAPPPAAAKKPRIDLNVGFLGT